MKKQYEKLELEIVLFDKDVIKTSGDGYEDDPWGEEIGGQV